jgi:hypothetical protein
LVSRWGNQEKTKTTPFSFRFFGWGERCWGKWDKWDKWDNSVSQNENGCSLGQERQSHPEMKAETIVSAFPYLYENSTTNQRSSYAMKHDMEYLFDEYCSDEEVKEAFRDSVPHRPLLPTHFGQVSWLFSVKPKFELFWLRSPPSTRPKGARKTQWEAYQTALAWARLHQASHSAPAPASGSQ